MTHVNFQRHGKAQKLIKHESGTWTDKRKH